ncbi:YdcF family protein [Nocardia cyriacigeorgica]|nr:YdcF family protein [Nocardia cyriacigeorgica]
MSLAELPARIRGDVETLWAFGQMHQIVRSADIGIGLGSHDPTVADWTATLYHQGRIPKIVFSGANSPTTIAVFPRGEAVHYRERAIALGVPDEAVLVEPAATNTGENIAFTRELLQQTGLLDSIRSAILVCRPYHQRRSYAVCRKLWPEITIVCSSAPMTLGNYIDRIGDMGRVIAMLVGEVQRAWVYPAKGWAIPVDVPDHVRAAYQRLVEAGYDGRLLPE